MGYHRVGNQPKFHNIHVLEVKCQYYENSSLIKNFEIFYGIMTFSMGKKKLNFVEPQGS